MVAETLRESFEKLVCEVAKSEPLSDHWTGRRQRTVCATYPVCSARGAPGHKILEPSRP